jgi:tetratricopeptide (TPR) repeat protein
MELRPESTPALVGLVRIDIAEEKHAAAKARIEDRLQTLSGDVSVYILAGRTFANVGEMSKAENAFRKAIELQPSNIDAYMWLGALYKGQNRLDEARQQFEQAAQTNPRDGVVAKTIVGVILNLQNKHQEARKAYEEALALNPRAAVAANNLAWDYAINGGNLDVALQLAQTAKAELPNEASVSDTLGWIYHQKGMTTLAITSLREAAKQSPTSPSIHARLGQAYVKDKDYPSARKSFQEALRISQSFPEADQTKKALAALPQ